MPTTDAWRRLGELLVRRRIELDPRYSNRQVFTRERGINYRTVGDIERGARTNFDSTTFAAIEVAYGLAPGAVAAVLAGGDLEAARPPQPDPQPPRLSAVPDRPSLPDDPTDKDLHYFIAAQEPYELRKLLLDTLYFEAVKYPERIRGIRALTDPVDLGEAPAERRREPGA